MDAESQTVSSHLLRGRSIPRVLHRVLALALRHAPQLGRDAEHLECSYLLLKFQNELGKTLKYYSNPTRSWLKTLSHMHTRLSGASTSKVTHPSAPSEPMMTPSLLDIMVMTVPWFSSGTTTSTYIMGSRIVHRPSCDNGQCQKNCSWSMNRRGNRLSK